MVIGVQQYTDPALQGLRYAAKDARDLGAPYAPGVASAVVIGAGMGGLNAAMQLKKAGNALIRVIGVHNPASTAKAGNQQGARNTARAIENFPISGLRAPGRHAPAASNQTSRSM